MNTRIIKLFFTEIILAAALPSMAQDHKQWCKYIYKSGYNATLWRQFSQCSRKHDQKLGNPHCEW